MFHHRWMGRSQGLVRLDRDPIFFRMRLGLVPPEQRESLTILWHRINFLCTDRDVLINFGTITLTTYGSP